MTDDSTTDIKADGGDDQAHLKPDEKPERKAAARKGRKTARKASAKSAAKTVAKDIETRIGYSFTDAALLASALTHVSALKSPTDRAASYQRLDFLGIELVDDGHGSSRAQSNAG